MLAITLPVGRVQQVDDLVVEVDFLSKKFVDHGANLSGAIGEAHEFGRYTSTPS